MMIFLGILVVLVIFIYVFTLQPQFGRAPSGERLGQLKRSPHYRNGRFENRLHTPAISEGETYARVMKKFFFGKSKRAVPSAPLPSKKTDLLHLGPSENILVWFGHASYFLQVDGKRFLVDPVLSGHASPVTFTTRSFKGSDVYSAADIPDIDYLLITHDHYDHLDYRTILELRPRIGKVVTGLGTGAHFERWGFEPGRIVENDWDATLSLGEGFTLQTVTARHFSGRAFKRNNTLWLSFILSTPSRKIFIGGDSGYGPHFSDIGRQHGPFDLAILENGQYNESWKYIHMLPEQAVKAAEELRAKALLPVHWGKFSLSLHAWDEPIKRLTAEADKKEFPVFHPMIGEAVQLDDLRPFPRWWEGVE